jgi:UDP-N-acetylglucosamine--N-acetylmuramyl-(pentapeptide) pyrophosphoryl-undecaprenol N-acetylglucosamine transferase
MSAGATLQRGDLVVLAAGGTGGHIFPAQALARALLARGLRVALVTDRRGGGFGAELAEVETHHVAAGALVGGGLLGKLKGALRLAFGSLQAFRLLGRLAPATVVGFGGYASVPTVFAAARRRLRIVLHEQNQVIGRANRLLAPKAALIATSFAPVAGLSARDQAKLRLTGNPVRPAITAIGTQPYSLPGPDQPLHLLVTGGSQGAMVFDSLVPEALLRLPEALRRRLQVSQQFRGSAREETAERYAAAGIAAELKPFFDNMPQRLAAAHLAICRAGASSISELAAAGRPAILVPLPSAADDHQSGNARAFEDAGGGWATPQGSLDAEALATRLETLFTDAVALPRAAACARAFARDDAAERLADLVCGTTRANGNDGDRDRAEDGREAAA